jgi:hypothetical protein
MLFVAVHNSPAIQIVGRKFDRDFVSRQYPYEVLPHLAGNVRQYLVLVFELHLVSFQPSAVSPQLEPSRSALFPRADG